MAQDLNVFSSVAFKAEQKMYIVRVGETLQIEGVRYTDKGIPRLKIGEGQYITAYKKRFE